MYPSIKFGLVEKAIHHFLYNASNADRERAKQCLELVKFGMTQIFITFKDTYWIYRGTVSMYLKGLTICGFKLASFVNLVVAYFLENSRELFLDTISDETPERMN